MQMQTALKNDDIRALYERFVVKDAEYFQRFRDIRGHFCANELAVYETLDPPRMVSLVDFKDWIAAYDLDRGKRLLLTSREDYEIRYLDYEETTLAEYPPHDLHVLDLPRRDHDFVLLNQTLEHLHTPLVALERLREHMREGGFIYITVPTLNIPHMTPIHFWGMTPIGLCALAVQAGFQICECGYWGNLKYIRHMFARNRWPQLKDVLTWGKLETDSACQAQTWILARKVKGEDCLPEREPSH
jgi:SAM-dependent methyltransferase